MVYLKITKEKEIFRSISSMYRTISNIYIPSNISKNENTDGKLTYVIGDRREHKLI